MKWLAPVIAEVQRQCPNSVFEVIGGDCVARIFKGIPRVSVLPTMSWPDYLKHTQSVRQDIGLAPLRDTLFNRGRGPIKFFDYARAGAVGVYSAGPAFSDFVSHEVDGYVLRNDPELWVKTIVNLVNSPQLRQQMAEAAWLKVLDNSPASPNVQEYLSDLNEALIQLSSINTP
jgi:glycosyltransferase involved in cell wall biosynthesis